MSYSSGTFSLYTPGNPVVTGTTISSTWANNTLSDIATGLTTCLLKDGTQTVTADISFGAYAIEANNFYGRNFLLNGGFSVVQCGAGPFTSATNPANNDDTYLIDQWILLSDGNDVVDVSRITTAAQKATASYGALRSDIETEDLKFGYLQILSNNKSGTLWNGATGTVSLSFSTISSVSLTIKAAVLAWTGTADTVTSDIISAWGADGVTPTYIANVTSENVSAAITSTTSLTRYTIENIALDTAATNNIMVFIWSDDMSQAVADTWDISGVKLEPGRVSTPYIESPYEAELKDCQYYFYRLTRAATSENVGVGFSTSTTTSLAVQYFPVVMRIAPTMSVSNVGDFTIVDTTAGVDTSNLVSAIMSTRSCTMTATVAAGLTDGQGSVVTFDGTAGGFIQFTAEL